MTMEERSADEEDENRSKTLKVKTCKGTLYYSSFLKSQGRNPSCFGLSNAYTIQPQQVPRFVRESGAEATKEGQTLTDFRYACVGLSMYLDDKDASDDGNTPGTVLPICNGIKVLSDIIHTADHTKEDGCGLPQPQPHKPAQPIQDGFFTKFTRNAGVVASGVGRNMCRVGIYIKDSVEEMVYPVRKRPK